MVVGRDPRPCPNDTFVKERYVLHYRLIYKIQGYSKSPLGEEAFIWDEINGMRSLKDVLVNDLSLDISSWTLNAALGISYDGLTIVGYGTNPEGYTEGWVTTIPEPATLLLLALGALMVRRKR
jgi:hypothetical protein